MSKEVIKKIIIEIAGTEVAVTPQQAKDLHSALDELLGLSKPAIKVIEKEIIRDRYRDWAPYFYKYTPTWTTAGTPQPDSPYTISYLSGQSPVLKIN